MSGSKDGSLRVWDLQRGACIGHGALGDAEGGGVTDLAAISTGSAAGSRGEAEAQLFASSTAGALHAFRVSDAGLEVVLVATAASREEDTTKAVR